MQSFARSARSATLVCLSILLSGCSAVLGGCDYGGESWPRWAENGQAVFHRLDHQLPQFIEVDLTNITVKVAAANRRFRRQVEPNPRIQFRLATPTRGFQFDPMGVTVEYKDGTLAEPVRFVRVGYIRGEFYDELKWTPWHCNSLQNRRLDELVPVREQTCIEIGPAPVKKDFVLHIRGLQKDGVSVSVPSIDFEWKSRFRVEE